MGCIKVYLKSPPPPSSYLLSMFAVASSRIRMRQDVNMARHRHISCLWPTLKFEPPSTTWYSNWSGRSDIASWSWTLMINNATLIYLFIWFPSSLVLKPELSSTVSQLSGRFIIASWTRCFIYLFFVQETHLTYTIRKLHDSIFN